METHTKEKESGGREWKKPALIKKNNLVNVYA